MDEETNINTGEGQEVASSGEVQQTQQPEAQQQATPAAPTGPSEVRLAADTVNQLAGALKPQQQEQPLTPEQVNQMLNVYMVNEEDATQLGLQPTAVQHLNRVLDAKVKQAVTMAALQIEAMRRTFTQQFGPVQQFMQKAQEQQLRQRFFDGNKDLQGFEPIVEHVYTNMVQRGQKFTSEAEAFKVVADEARQLIAKLPGVRNGQTQQQQGGQPTQRVSTVTTGGQGGAGTGAAGGTLSESQKLARSLFFS